MELLNVDLPLGEGLASNEEDLMKAIKYVADTLNEKSLYGTLVVTRTDDGSVYMKTDIGVMPTKDEELLDDDDYYDDEDCDSEMDNDYYDEEGNLHHEWAYDRRRDTKEVLESIKDKLVAYDYVVKTCGQGSAANAILEDIKKTL